MMYKLVVGTANFGLPYGIARHKKLDRGEALSILECARAHGVWGVDTAKAYGDAEQVVGDFFARYGKTFKVIDKLPHREYKSARDVEEEIFDSLKNMNISFLDVLLVHSFETYERYGQTILPVLQSLSRDGVIGHYGVSVYHPSEAERIRTAINGNFALEFPLNLFDQRFLKGDLLRELKDDGAVLFARSVFLQGLFFLDAAGLEGNFVKVRENVRKIAQLSKEHHLSRECLALLFVAEKECLDGIILGVDGRDHFVSNTECFSDTHRQKFTCVSTALYDLEIHDEDIILPYRWKVCA